ncbi:PEST proteolytic signal-containing nuclear protein [Nephila pilipes]|uniref:PEST proteolytic signal-containing nuclear protein n=1 Tax=Nephila pilipes TaxID=299642 RepID=A0A8X6QCT8_NEPPI|nr:PEST proteolytic signal-containing nuclear protein [Nephila pilipes]
MADIVEDRDGNPTRKEGLSRSDVSGQRPLPGTGKAADGEKRKFDDDDDIDGVAMDDADPKKLKVSAGFNKTFGSLKTVGFSEKKNPAPITIKLGSQKNKDGKPTLQKTSASVASAFNQESDEEEEMPPEARMRMRNIGRDTPTSAGPNSFGKTRQGFCDSKKVFERQLKEKMEQLADE